MAQVVVRGECDGTYSVCWQTGIKNPRVKATFWRGESKSEAEIFRDVFSQLGSFKLMKSFFYGVGRAGLYIEF